jgi:hypothetical protein
LKRHRRAAGSETVKTGLHDGTGLPREFLEKLDQKQRCHRQSFATIPHRLKENSFAPVVSVIKGSRLLNNLCSRREAAGSKG